MLKNDNRFESLPGYLQKLDFKYFEIQLFHVTDFDLLVPNMS